jgi:chaperone BCS1
MIILFEDFDMYFGNKDISKKQDDVITEDMIIIGSQDMDEKSAQNLVFQMLDGEFSMEDVIYIATTNHIEQIDEAMIRHGRFDIQEEIKYFDHDLAVEFLKSFGYDEKFFEQYYPTVKFPIQPAFLQAKIMEVQSKMMLKEGINE